MGRCDLVTLLCTALSGSLFAAAWDAVGSGELISFVLEEVVARETSEAVTPAMQVHCLKEAAEAAGDARLAKSFKGVDLPKILYALTSEHDKVRSGASDLLEASKDFALGPYSALVKFLASERAAVMADAEGNVPQGPNSIENESSQKYQILSFFILRAAQPRRSTSRVPLCTLLGKVVREFTEKSYFGEGGFSSGVCYFSRLSVNFWLGLS